VALGTSEGSADLSVLAGQRVPPRRTRNSHTPGCRGGLGDGPRLGSDASTGNHPDPRTYWDTIRTLRQVSLICYENWV